LKTLCAKRKPKPMNSAAVWFKFSNKYKYWQQTSATSKTKLAN
jgi:translation initiation factor 2B subunit (eIF-2B alpha/beta/delta family)